MQLSDDEFPSVAKELSSSCTMFLFLYQMSLKSEDRPLILTRVRLQDPKNWNWTTKICLLRCRGFPS